MHSGGEPGNRAARWLLAAALLPVLCPTAPAQRGRAEPFFQLRLENARLFTETDYAPLFRGLGDLLARHFAVRGEAQRARLADAWPSLGWPLEATVVAEPRSVDFLVGVSQPLAGTPLSVPLLELGEGAAGDSRRVPAEDDRWSYRELSFSGVAPRLGLCEAALDDRRVLLVGEARGVDAAAAGVGLWTRVQERPPRSMRILAEHARGGDLGWLLSFRSLAASWGADDEPALLGAVKIMLGPRFAGVSGRMRAENGKLLVEMFADVRPGRGWIGTMLHRSPRELELTRWIPEGVTDFIALDPSIDGMVRNLNQLQMFGGLRAGDLSRDAAFLGDIELGDFLDTHFTGQVVAMSEKGIETQWAETGKLEGFALGFGCEDSARLLAEVKAIVAAGEAEDPTCTLRETPELGPGMHTLTWRAEPTLYLVAAREILFVAGADRGSAALLRKCLATGGRRPSLGVATMVGRGHVIRYLLEALGDQGPDEAMGLQSVVESFLDHHDGVASWRLTVEGNGTRLRLDL